MPERVRSDGFGDPGAARDLADDPPGAVPVQPAPVRGQEDRPGAAFPGGQSIALAVCGASGMVTTLPPLRVIVRVRWPRSRPRGGRGDVGGLGAGPGGQVQLGCYATDISQLHQLPQLVPVAFPAGAGRGGHLRAGFSGAHRNRTLGRSAGRRGLGERDSRPLREAVGELVAAIPFSLKPVHGRTCPRLRAAQAHQQKAIDQLKAAVQSYLHAGAYRDTARPRYPARARHQSGPRVSGDQRDNHHCSTRLQLIEQYRRASCGPAPAGSGGC